MSDQLDRYLRLNSSCVLRSLVKVYRCKEEFPGPVTDAFDPPQLKTLGGFKTASPLTSLTDVPAVMRDSSSKAEGQRQRVRRTHFPVTPPQRTVPKAQPSALRAKTLPANVDIWEVNTGWWGGGGKTKELTMCVNHGFPALSIETFPETSGDRSRGE